MRKAKIAESAVMGTMVQALCGEVFPVTKAPKPGSPVCPALQGDLRRACVLIRRRAAERRSVVAESRTVCQLLRGCRMRGGFDRRRVCSCSIAALNSAPSSTPSASTKKNSSAAIGCGQRAVRVVVVEDEA